jgi:hypothetical protein
VRKVNRYYCDFCPKANCSRPSIEKHEASCTLNPNRVCRMCALMEGGEDVAEPLSVLIALLPDASAIHPEPGTFCAEDAYSNLAAALKAAMPVLRKAAANCPACIMAALRQARIPVPIAEDFDFQKESKAILDEYNANRMEEMHQYAHAY